MASSWLNIVLSFTINLFHSRYSYQTFTASVPYIENVETRLSLSSSRVQERGKKTRDNGQREITHTKVGMDSIIATMITLQTTNICVTLTVHFHDTKKTNLSNVSYIRYEFPLYIMYVPSQESYLHLLYYED